MSHCMLPSPLLRPRTVAAAALLTYFACSAALADNGPGPAVLTGTHIRGNTDSASPITIYNRDAIESSGAGTLQQFIQTIPQNFNGGASETTLGSITGGGNAVNQVDGTGVNLRGLGNDATLVLVNGHRVAPGNLGGNFVDIALIPLYAVERIELVTDGASAIYGSDAVGGVINIILGRNLDGAETRSRYGAVTGGSSHDTQVGQTLGHGWDTGSALVIYDYDDRTPLSAASRGYTDSAPQPFMLLPEQVRQSAFLSLEDSVTDTIQLFAEGSYSHRSSYADRTIQGVTERTRSVIDAYSATAGARIGLPRGAELELAGTYTASDTNHLIVPTGLMLPAEDEQAHSSILSVDAKLDGRFLSLPGGDVRFAIGTQFRQEKFAAVDLLAASSFRPERHVTAAFAELRMPIVGPRDAASAAKRLELTLAARAEHYSDFGSSTDPQIGLIWRPLEELKLRGTYGRSFRAPLLNDLNPVPFEVVPVPEPDPQSGGLTNTMVVFGGNPELKPEMARTWTAGLDFAPPLLAVHASATYYDINFTDVITDPEFNVDITDALSQEAVLGPAVIQRSPSATRVQQLAATPGFMNLFGIDLATVGAIVDSRVHNLSIVRTRGLDLDGSWTAGLPLGNLELGLNGTYILKFESEFTRNAPTVSVLNTVYNPVDLRLRGRLVFRLGGLTFASFINYTAPYREDDTAGARPIASWTTVDVTAKYLFSAEKGPLADATLLLAVTNIMDHSPPFALNPVFGINYDGANANALGRVLALQLAKRW